TPVILSCWLLAAHFLRFGGMIPFIVLVLLPLALFVRRKAIPKLMSALLILMAGKWLVVTYEMITVRLMMGDDWIRMLCIMGAVVIFTLVSVCCFQNERVSAYYSSPKQH
ncbi:hypothetical protein, partial [Photobacterium sanctipauli]